LANDIKLNITSALRSVMQFKRIKQSDIAGLLEITPQAVSQKMKNDLFNNQDISILNKSLGVNLIEIANKLEGGNGSMNIVAESVEHYKTSPAAYLSLTSEEAKQIILNQTRTIDELRAQMDAIRPT
jgi:predicted transcriptional regulator